MKAKLISAALMILSCFTSAVFAQDPLPSWNDTAPKKAIIDFVQPQLVEKIFYAFEQVDSQSEGLGLGLALSKAIVEIHAGTIRAGSDGLDKGATFAIDLPIRGSNH